MSIRKLQILVDPDIEGTPFSEKDDDFILNGGYTLENTALQMGRSLRAVRSRKKNLQYVQNQIKRKKEQEEREKAEALEEKKKELEKPITSRSFYSEEDDKLIMDTNVPIKDIAKQLERTYYGIKARRRLLRDKARGVDINAKKRRQYQNGGKETKQRWREKNKDHINKYNSEYIAFNAGSENAGKPFTEEEDEILLDSSISRKDRALKLGRSLASVAARLRKLRRPENIKSTSDKYTSFNSDAENSGPYSPEEDLVVLDPNLSAKEMALKLDRTLNSVRGRLRKLRKIQKEKEALEDGKGL